MEKGFGKKTKAPQMYTKDIMSMIKSLAKEFLLGVIKISTGDNF